MSTKSFFSLSLLALALPLSAADLSPTAKDAPAPTAVPTVMTATAKDAPAATSPSAAAPAPALPDALSGTPEVLAAPSPTTVTGSVDDNFLPEEVGEDGGTQAKLESPDLSKLDSETLASIANGVDKDSTEVLFDPAAKQVMPDAAPGAWKVNVDALYYELAKRTLNDNKDKAARQAFALTLFKDADRAKYAKDLAYDDKLADTVIGQLEGGRPRARMELQTLAEKGNRKARAYLGLDKPTERVEAGALSPTALPVAASGTAVLAPAAATALSATTAPAALTTTPAKN